MIVDIAYGGALIIRETTTGHMASREVLNSHAQMSLYNVIEDTLVMLAGEGKPGAFSRAGTFSPCW